MTFKVKRFIWLALCCFFVQAAWSVSIQVTDLRTEQLVNPLGLDIETPRFSWRILSDQRNTQQTAYRILVASTPEKLAKDSADIWDSNTVQSDASIWIDYQGPKLTPNKRYYWKVRIHTNAGESEWSKTAHWGMGLMGEVRWADGLA